MALFKPGDRVIVVKEDPDPVYGSGGGAYHRVGDRGVVAAGSGDVSSIRFFQGRISIRVHFPERNHTWWAYEHELKRVDHGLLDI